MLGGSGVFETRDVITHPSKLSFHNIEVNYHLLYTNSTFQDTINFVSSGK